MPVPSFSLNLLSLMVSVRCTWPLFLPLSLPVFIAPFPSHEPFLNGLFRTICSSFFVLEEHVCWGFHLDKYLQRPQTTVWVTLVHLNLMTFQKFPMPKFIYSTIRIFSFVLVQGRSSHVLFLMQQKKKNDKSTTSRFVSVPNLSALESGGVGNGHPNRLDPIPNSPIHDTEFSSNKALLQPVPPKQPKTFLRWATSHQWFFF